MSIVERALQKAQQAAKSAGRTDATDDKARSADPASEVAATPAPAPMVEQGPSQPSAEAVTAKAYDERLSLTARDLKPIVQIDSKALREVGRLPPEDMALQTDEEIRRIKWPLLNAITGRDGSAPCRNNVILVTSAVPGEGKTFVSLSLALSIVRDREMRVILVDGDVARPGLTPSIGLEGRPGLNDVLDDETLDISAVTYQTDVEGLFLVPAGKWHEHSPEFFASSRMPRLLEELSRRVGNGVIVLDSPPLLATNESQAVTRYVGQVLMVVRADRTEQRAVLDALALVDGSTPVKAVLNCVEATAVSRYYGQYYYGYGSRYGYGYGRESGKRQP